MRMVLFARTVETDYKITVVSSEEILVSASRNKLLSGQYCIKTHRSQGQIDEIWKGGPKI